MKSINPSELAIWKRLKAQAELLKRSGIKPLFNEASHAQQFCIQWKDFYVDFSKNYLSTAVFGNLLKLTTALHLKEAIASYFSGDLINETEGRAVLHTALRSRPHEQVFVGGKDIIPEIQTVKTKIKRLSEIVISGEKKGYTNKPFTDIVNIGIGGSDLGPRMVVKALAYYKNALNIHFVSNIDGDHVMEILNRINPETTLFIIVSKTFTTQETISNANTIKAWFLRGRALEASISKHFIAVSTNIPAVLDFGIAKDNIFPMWDWVGGRFSLWSAVGLSIALSLGYDNYSKLLEGAHAMDLHFRNEKFPNNIPVVLALLSVWYNNFMGSETEAIIPYTHYLDKFVPYLQQGFMESNGKCIDRNGNRVDYQTGTILWGSTGTNAQHAFFQLLHQGTKLIPCDFIGFKRSLHGNQEHHNKLMSNFLAQTEALLNGKSTSEVRTALESQGCDEATIRRLLPFKGFEGNKPTNTILIDALTPSSLGALIALYEHKIFIQGILWNIFSYDQWGVVLGKQLADTVLADIEGNISSHDDATRRLIAHFKGF